MSYWLIIVILIKKTENQLWKDLLSHKSIRFSPNLAARGPKVKMVELLSLEAAISLLEHLSIQPYLLWKQVVI